MPIYRSCIPCSFLKFLDPATVHTAHINTFNTQQGFSGLPNFSSPLRVCDNLILLFQPIQQDQPHSLASHQVGHCLLPQPHSLALLATYHLQTHPPLPKGTHTSRQCARTLSTQYFDFFCSFCSSAAKKPPSSQYGLAYSSRAKK